MEDLHNTEKGSHPTVSEAPILDDDLSDIKKGTATHQKNMWRMGKVQLFQRNFHFVSMFAFSTVLMAS